ncbi:MAG: hypothetical protein UY73_C0050G0012 [Parcubacteria group bacterium GW2011_GWA2_52_8]|nr:MAG: hypothetical protein UY73_C0050G0012 [Parcubacteria group bacterium GW2011_GWA2_52_8]
MRTKTFISLLIAAVLLIIVGGGIFIFFNSDSTEPGEEQSDLTPPKIRVVAEERVLSPVFSGIGEYVWFMAEDGKIYRQKTDGGEAKEEIVLPEPVIGAVRVIWPPQGQNFIIEQNLDGHVRYLSFDSFNNRFTEYDAGIRNPRFLPAGDKVIYDRVTGAGAHELKIADADGNNFAKIADLFRPDYDFAVSPNGHEAAAWSTSQVTASPLFLIDLFTGKFDVLGDAGFYRGAKFSPDGSRLLVSKSNQAGISGLAVLMLSPRKASDVGLYAPIDEAVWEADSSAFWTTGVSGVLRYRVDTQEISEVFKFPEGEKPRVSSLLVYPNETFFLFVDEETGFLYRADARQ